MHEMRAAPGYVNGRVSGGGMLAAIGAAMLRYRHAIIALQWLVVILYAVLLIVPVFMPIPGDDARFHTNLRLFAQFLFWGIWWPFVMLSTMLFGRVWCGVLCPEGTLTEFASHHGLGRAIPRWMRWAGWPFVAFASTTVYGQLISVYAYSQAALLILGSSTMAAVAVGFAYGRGKRIWCRYLCPANGVFALLAKVAPLHFLVDEEAWKRNTTRQPMVNCAPLIDIRHMKSASACHACGRCSGYRGAVQLATRNPTAEILGTRNKDVTGAEAFMLIFGVIGIATAAFQWPVSRWFAEMKTAAATWLIERDVLLLLQDNAPWWLLTHYPQANDVFTWLDGLCLLAFILGGGMLLGAAVLAPVRLAARCANDVALSWRRLSLALVPLAGTGVVLGLSMLTLEHLKAEGVALGWVPAPRIMLLAAGTGFSTWLGWKLLIDVKTPTRRIAAFAIYGMSLAVIDAVWVITFFG
jgi:polyferredoxin